MNKIILNEEQKIAVKTESRKALLIAGAGSGKTRVLIERIAHLIEEKNVSPYEICAFTFTRKAGQEITERLVKRLGNKAHKITTGTMHSVALKFLQRFGELIGLQPEKITIYNQWESDFLLKEVAKDLGYHNGYKWVKVKVKDVVMVMNDFNSCKIDQMLDNEDFNVIDDYSCEYGECIDIVNAFNARCKENNALTYDSILYKFYKLLPEIKQYLGFRHIFVDETQDNSPLQWDITNKMTELCDASLFVLGDINQSIYSFRGADPEYLVRNQGLFDVLKLRKNYRSDANIVEAANRLISHNKNTIKLEMEAVKESVVDITVLKSINSEAIKSLLSFKDEILSENIAVLARNHFMLEKLSDLLNESGIKHNYIGKQSKVVHSENFIRFHAFLKLIVNPNDNFAFMLIRYILQLSTNEYSDVRVMAAEQGKSHYEVWKHNVPPFYESDWEDWFKSSEKGDMDTVIDWLKFVDFGFEIDAMLEFVYLWRLENYDKGIDDYLNWLATYDIHDEIKKDSETLQLMTVHAAKGLEFETVIIAGLNETILPSKQAIQKNEIEEERRLAYVAITRAEQQLILTSRPFDKDLFEIKNPVSRFVKESL